jgi:hypothetical protein
VRCGRGAAAAAGDGRPRSVRARTARTRRRVAIRGEPDWCPVFLDASIRQFEGLDEADEVLINSFDDIEPKVRSLQPDPAPVCRFAPM